MPRIESELAQEICFGDLPLSSSEWFAQEVDALASRFSGLDSISRSAIFTLAQLSAIGGSDLDILASATGLDPGVVEESLEALCEYEFVKECTAGFETTDRGTKAFRAIGRNLVTRRLFEMKRNYEHLDRVFQKLEAWK